MGNVSGVLFGGGERRTDVSRKFSEEYASETAHMPVTPSMTVEEDAARYPGVLGRTPRSFRKGQKQHGSCVNTKKRSSAPSKGTNKKKTKVCRKKSRKHKKSPRDSRIPTGQEDDEHFTTADEGDSAVPVSLVQVEACFISPMLPTIASEMELVARGDATTSEDENKDMVVAVLAKIEELQKEPEGARITEEEPSCAIVEAARTRGALKNALYGGIDFSVMKDFSEPGGGGSWIGDAHMEPSKKVMARSAPLRNFKCKV